MSDLYNRYLEDAKNKRFAAKMAKKEDLYERFLAEGKKRRDIANPEEWARLMVVEHVGFGQNAQPPATPLSLPGWVRWWALIVLLLLAADVARGQGGPPPVIIDFQNAGSLLYRFAGGQMVFNCSTGTTCTWDSGTRTVAATATVPTAASIGASYVLTASGVVTPVAGNGAAQSKYSYTLPGGTMGSGGCINVEAVITHENNAATFAPRILFGAITIAPAAFAATSEYATLDVVICNNPGSTSAQTTFARGINTINSTVPGSYFQTGTVNTANNVTITADVNCNAGDNCGGWFFMVTKL